MHEVRVALLERLSGVDDRAGTGQFTLGGEEGAVVRSVVHNLRKVLNSREGSAPAQPEYGLPSPHELLQNWPASRAQALEAIRRCIGLFEPRLVDVAVRAVQADPGQLALGFQISARLVGSQQAISFTTAVTAAGRVTLR